MSELPRRHLGRVDLLNTEGPRLYGFLQRQTDRPRTRIDRAVSLVEGKYGRVLAPRCRSGRESQGER